MPAGTAPSRPSCDRLGDWTGVVHVHSCPCPSHRSDASSPTPSATRSRRAGTAAGERLPASTSLAARFAVSRRHRPRRPRRPGPTTSNLVTGGGRLGRHVRSAALDPRGGWRRVDRRLGHRGDLPHPATRPAVDEPGLQVEVDAADAAFASRSSGCATVVGRADGVARAEHPARRRPAWRCTDRRTGRGLAHGDHRRGRPRAGERRAVGRRRALDAGTPACSTAPRVPRSSGADVTRAPPGARSSSASKAPRPGRLPPAHAFGTAR